MAPTKDTKEAKEAKLTPAESAALIMDYLRKQNRPYSATDISTNLKNRVTKAAAAKLLKDMHERQEIEGRASGKQVVYHVLQDEQDEDEAERLAEMEAETTRLREETLEFKTQEKDARVTLRDDGNHVSIASLKASVADLETQKDEMHARLEKLRSGGFQPVSVEERQKVAKEHRMWGKRAGARKKIRRELWREIQGMVPPEKVAETKEELGLEF